MSVCVCVEMCVSFVNDWICVCVCVCIEEFASVGVSWLLSFWKCMWSNLRCKATEAAEVYVCVVRVDVLVSGHCVSSCVSVYVSVCIYSYVSERDRQIVGVEYGFKARWTRTLRLCWCDVA